MSPLPGGDDPLGELALMDAHVVAAGRRDGERLFREPEPAVAMREPATEALATEVPLVGPVDPDVTPADPGLEGLFDE